MALSLAERTDSGLSLGAGYSCRLVPRHGSIARATRPPGHVGVPVGRSLAISPSPNCVTRHPAARDDMRETWDRASR